ncbi:GDP-mannose-dependent alpha-(1-6)-phosphatidylinositol monomannoside mannosyltransferase [bacterium BMS3Abin11]|nr:GDP-mannose-dependent alpha-(1-6)-phosphatidylinositol monomannoside mannosyltransferase [bacterium BMS3Abin11]
MKKTILLVADMRGWIFDRHCQEIQKRISEYKIDITYLNDGNIETLYSDYDLIYLLDPFQLNFSEHKKVIMGLRGDWLFLNYPGGARQYYKSCIKKRCCILHVVNQRQYQIFKPLVGENPLMMVRHGVDELMFNKDEYLHAAHNGFIVGWAGKTDSNGDKGLDLIQEACARLGVVCLTAKYNNSGQLHKNQMPHFYSQIDVLCCMSRSEGCWNPLLEAGAMGIPVISTRVGAAEEIIQCGVNGLLVDRNVDSLVEALDTLTNNPEQCRVMGKHLRETILSSWTWDQRIQDYREMFDYYFSNIATAQTTWLHRIFGI